jgi:hypothetical protein
VLPLTAGRWIIDLTYLVRRHQLSLAASTAAPSREARAAHRGLTIGYADRIASLNTASLNPAASLARVA